MQKNIFIVTPIYIAQVRLFPSNIHTKPYIHVYIPVQPFACHGYVAGKKISDANWKAGSFKYPGARGAVNNVPETRVCASGW